MPITRSLDVACGALRPSVGLAGTALAGGRSAAAASIWAGLLSIGSVSGTLFVMDESMLYLLVAPSYLPCTFVLRRFHAYVCGAGCASVRVVVGGDESDEAGFRKVRAGRGCYDVVTHHAVQVGQWSASRCIHHWRQRRFVV